MTATTIARKTYETVVANNIYWKNHNLVLIENTEKKNFETMDPIEKLGVVCYLYWLSELPPDPRTMQEMIEDEINYFKSLENGIKPDNPPDMFFQRRT